MSLLNHGLSALMEACKQSENAEVEENALFEAFDEAIDEDIRACLTGEDTVEEDMEGDGLDDEDDEKMEKLLKTIPPSDEGIEDQIEALTESMVPSDELKYVY